jgi:hypothetical protein
MHAPPTMKSDGSDAYVWIEPDEKFLIVSMGDNRWLTCAVIAEHARRLRPGDESPERQGDGVRKLLIAVMSVSTNAAGGAR